MSSEERGATGIKRLEIRIGKLWAFRREREGEVTKLSPENTIRRLIHLFTASISTISSFLRKRMGEGGLTGMFEYQGEKFGEGWEKYTWRADDIARNMIRLNFQPFGIEAHYSGDEKKATITIEKCTLPENFLHSVEYLKEVTLRQEGALDVGQMFSSLDKVSSSWDWPPKKTEVCATCRIVMPKLGEKLGFTWNHRITRDAPPKCVFDIEIVKQNKA